MTEREQFKKEDFEDSPRFIPMNTDDDYGFYIFDTEKLDYLGFSHLYPSIHNCNIVCDILNTMDYLLKEKK